MDLNTLHQLAAYRPQQPMRPQAAPVPQTAPDPYAQAWQRQAMQPPAAPQMQPKPQAPPMAAPMAAPNPNDPTAPVTVTPQVGVPSGGGTMDKLMSLIRMFGFGANPSADPSAAADAAG